VQASSIRLDLQTDLLHDSSQVIHSPFKQNEEQWNPTNWIRTPCFDIKWELIIVNGVVGEESNRIQRFLFTMAMSLNNKNGFAIRQKIAALEKCWKRDWELLLNGQWQPTAVGFILPQKGLISTFETVVWSPTRGIPYTYNWSFDFWKHFICH